MSFYGVNNHISNYLKVFYLCEYIGRKSSSLSYNDRGRINDRRERRVFPGDSSEDCGTKVVRTKTLNICLLVSH